MKKGAEIIGIPINSLSYADVLERIDRAIKNDHKIYIATVNPEMILNASQDEDFYDVLGKAEIRTPDGIGILWATYYLSLPKRKGKIKIHLQLIGSLFAVLFRPKKIRSVINERITGSDLMPKVIDYSQKKKWRIFLLGASDGIAKKAEKKLSKKYPDTFFAGSYAGSPKTEDQEEICNLINESRPDILFVAYGSPNQELWIHRNLFKLETVNVAIGVGGAFDFHAGKIKRAPRFMQKLGMEWLWRLFREPKRIARIWNATVRFIRLVARGKMEK